MCVCVFSDNFSEKDFKNYPRIPNQKQVEIWAEHETGGLRH